MHVSNQQSTNHSRNWWVYTTM